MSDTFCFSVERIESNKVAVFHSASGDDYYVKYTASKFGEISLSIEWLTSTQNLVKVELFGADFNLITSQNRIGLENLARFNFCIDLNQLPEDKGNLIVMIYVIPYINTMDSSTNTPESLNINDDKIKEFSEDLLVGFAMDIRDLLIHGDLSDTIITNGNRAMKVHAAILSARSPVLREFFRNALPEKIVTASHVSDEALEDFVHFIYSGLIKFKDMDRAEELYELAKEYEVEDLHDICSVYMSNFTTDRVLQTLILAEDHRDDKLKSSAINYILRNIGEVKSSKKWASFAEANLDLVSEIYNCISGDAEKTALPAFLSRVASKKN